MLLIIASAVFIWFMAQKGPAEVESGNIITVGTNAEYPPFSFIKDDQVVGLDIDVAFEVCKRLNKDIELKDMSFDALIPSAQVGTVHIIAAGLTATPERAEQVLFTRPHFMGKPLEIVTLASSQAVETVEELEGKEVVVNDGFTADFYMSKIKGVKLIRLPNITDAFMALKTGRVYAFVTARDSIAPFFKINNKDDFNFVTIANTRETYSLAISKKHPELLNPVQKTLDEMRKDGTIEQLLKKWELA